VSTLMTDLTVGDVMLSPDRIPVVHESRLLKEVLEEMTRFRLGIASIIDAEGNLAGIFTDGDVRRMLLKEQKPFAALFADDAIQHAVQNPTTTQPGEKLVDAFRVMEEREIWDLPVVDDTGKLVGLLHLHPAVKRLLGL